MSITLADFATDAPTDGAAPLLPIADDATLRVGTLTLAVCKRGTGEPVLARFRPGKDDGSVPDSWRQTARIADIARAIAGGLLA